MSGQHPTAISSKVSLALHSTGKNKVIIYCTDKYCQQLFIDLFQPTYDLITLQINH